MEAIRDLDISSYITEKTMDKLTDGGCLWREIFNFLSLYPKMETKS
jgi:hypothetical protein